MASESENERSDGKQRRPKPGFRLNAPQASEVEESGAFSGLGDDLEEAPLKPPSMSATKNQSSFSMSNRVTANTGLSNGNGQDGDSPPTLSDEVVAQTHRSSVASLMSTSASQSLKCLIVVGIMVIVLLIALIITVAIALGRDTNSTTTIIEAPTGADFPPSIPTLPPRTPTEAPQTPTSAPIDQVPTFEPQTTLGRVSQRGFLKCGVAESQPGFSEVNRQSGEREGIDVDLCKAVAAAIFGVPDEIVQGDETPARVEFSPVSAFDRFAGLANDDYDLLVRATTHTMERELIEPSTEQGYSFSIPYLYNGLQFAGKEPYVSCADNLSIDPPECVETKICALDSTTHIPIITSKLPDVQLLAVVKNDLLYTNFIQGQCNVIAGEQFDIAESLVRARGYVGNYTYGVSVHSKEPLAMVTRNDDAQWSGFVNWVLQSLLAAEEETITQRTSNFIPFTGVFDGGNTQGRFAGAFRNAVKAVGNYAEVYRRNLEALLPRPTQDDINPGDSGLLYSFPFGSIDGATVRDRPIQGGTLRQIKDRGFLRCGISSRVIFAQLNSTSQQWDGFDVDFCKAVSAAVFEGDTESVVYIDLPASERFKALQNSSVDLLSRLTTVTLSRDIREAGTEVGFAFSQPNFYDGLTFGGIPPFAGCADRLDVTSISCQELIICVNQGTTFEERLQTLFPSRFVKSRQSGELTVEGLVSGDCNVIAGGVVDVSLSSIRSTGYTGPYQTANGRYSKDPLALVTRDDDVEWASFIFWLVTAIFFAEEEGISQVSAGDMPYVNLFGPLFVDMFQEAIRAVGNYEEIYLRQAQADVPRGGLNSLNKLLSGPQHYALPGVV